MSKAILMSIQPKWVCEILNGNKTIEVRTKFPKDYVGWVYIYCTKDKKYANLINRGGFLTGMVVARFWCDKVEETFFQQEESFNNEIEKTLKDSCLTYDELWNYVGNKTFYKIHISQLEIFDKPKELIEFYKPCKYENIRCKDYCLKYKQYGTCEVAENITKAPQSWCYVETE